LELEVLSKFDKNAAAEEKAAAKKTGAAPKSEPNDKTVLDDNFIVQVSVFETKTKNKILEKILRLLREIILRFRKITE